MNNAPKSVMCWLIGLPIRLLAALCLTGVLFVILSVLLAGVPFQFRSIVAETLPKLLLLVLLAGYTWAVYFGLPFFPKRSRWQRVLISSVPALCLLFLTYLAAAAVMSAVFSGKSDQRVETVTLPSGEVLVNHTFREGPSLGGSGVRVNKLFLNNPSNGTSELVGDLNYEAEPSTPSLLAQSPHPQEIVRGDEKVLIIGSYICKRRIWKTGPEWDIASFDMAGQDAADYLKSFVKTNSTFFTSSYSSPKDYLHYQIENLDLENNVLTLKRIPWNAQTEPPEFRDFPDYLVYSAVGDSGKSGYQFPWKFDEARTRAKNGPRWENGITNANAISMENTNSVKQSD